MAGRKYASDYRLETHVAANGKTESVPVYQGKYYTFVQSAEQIRRFRTFLWICCGAVLLLMLPMLLDNTRLGRTPYVVFPSLFTLIPLWLLMAGARRLGFGDDPFIREHRDKTERRIRGASVALTVMLVVSCVGAVIHFWVNGFASAELLCVVCLFVALAVSIVLLTRRDAVKTRQLEEPESEQASESENISEITE